MDPRAIVAKVLEIPDEPLAWELRLLNNLALAHYSENADMETYGRIKGSIVDLETETIVCQSYEYTSMAVSNLDKEVWTPDDTGYIKLTDIYSRNYFFHQDNILIKPSFPGVILRVFKNKGRVYFSTHRRISAESSRWISDHGLTFIEMYQQLNGPTQEELFPTDQENSAFCYIFLVVHPDLVDVSKINFMGLAGFIVYMGFKEMWPTDQSPVELATSTDLVSGKLVSPTSMSINEANLFLNWGYLKPTTQIEKFVTHLFTDDPGGLELLYSDQVKIEAETAKISDELLSYFKDQLSADIQSEFLTQVIEWLYLSNDIIQSNDARLYPGEAVIIYRKVIDGSYQPALRIQSISYNWRDQMRNNQANLYYRFHELADKAKTGLRDQTILFKYLSVFPYMGDFEEKVVKEQLNRYGYIISWPVLDASLKAKLHYLSSYQHRLKNIWAAYVMAVPLSQQLTVWSMLDQYKTDKKSLAEWLFSLYRKWKASELELITQPSLKLAELGVCLEARKIICKSSQAGLKIKHNINKGVRMSNGRTLYRMVKNMKRVTASS